MLQQSPKRQVKPHQIQIQITIPIYITLTHLHPSQPTAYNDNGNAPIRCPLSLLDLVVL